MNSYSLVFLLSASLLGCTAQPAQEKLRDVQQFTIRIEEAFFATESGAETVVTPAAITKVRNKQGKVDSTVTKMTTEQASQVKKILETLPLAKFEPQYINKDIRDGGAVSFDFKLDGKSYQTSFVNAPLEVNLKGLVEALNKITPTEKIVYFR